MRVVRRPIYDEDGDGVEDNQHKTYDELDRHYYPNRFGESVEDIYNTHQGNLPGHRRLAEEDLEPYQKPLYPEFEDVVLHI